MKRYRQHYFTLLFASILALIPVLCLAEFKVIRVYDGDTVKAMGHDIEIKVRLIGIDAPETSKGKKQPGQPYCQYAKKYLSWLVLTEIVEIKQFGHDLYGRVLGVIYLTGQNINLEMVKVGLAEAYRGKSPKGFNIKPYKEAEEEARKTRRGMWVQEDKYMSPKDWRKMKKGK